MRLHVITEDEIESAIQKPEFLEPSMEGRLDAWVETSGKFLRVNTKKRTTHFGLLPLSKRGRNGGELN